MRKRIEEAFGWIKTIAGQAKTSCAADRVGWAFTLAAAAYNLVRLPKLMAVPAMNAPMDCQLIGRWRIVAADLWHRDYLDLGGLDILKPNVILLQQPRRSRARKGAPVRISVCVCRRCSQPTFLANTEVLVTHGMTASFDFEAKGELGAPVGCSGDHLSYGFWSRRLIKVKSGYPF